ncbi:hypothetical protein BOTBODRAFT_174246 [Botryobasidium botryosum FD-172 SS1]|uniref:Uncharacterized protein n=1 Tax=Botryobasidium botryosum (strain FD-172 SS1) TaxID=930990 RepID=A0A067MK08_BOTB1|nr:hypothetical protein BOTBODRAFT_174246 [Botryobasidium botryosum FD-172 SS1]
MPKKTAPTNPIQEILSLKGDARTWLKSHSACYEELDAEVTNHSGKCDRHSRPAFTRDVANKFINHFKLVPYIENGKEVNPLEGCRVLKESATLGNLREAILVWFHNNHSSKAAKQRAVNNALDIFAGDKKKTTQVSTKAAFGRDNGASIREKLKERLATLGLDSSSNLTYYWQNRDEMWGQLSQAEKEVHQSRADALNEEGASEDTEFKAFSNQKDLGTMLVSMLESLIGFGDKQIGDTCFHVQYATKDMDGIIRCEAFSNGANNITPFNESYADYATNLTNPFVKWANEGLKGQYPEPLPQVATLPINTPSVIIRDDGMPLLPTLDMDDTPNRILAQVLDHYFTLKWHK